MQMKHFKLSKDLTLAQNLMSLVLILSLSVILVSTINAKAEETTSDEDRLAAAVTLLRGGDAVDPNSCAGIQNTLAKGIADINKACGTTSLGADCRQSMFQCNEDSSDSEICESLNTTIGSSSSESDKMKLEDEKDELEKLEKNKKDLQDQKDQIQTELEELNGKLEDKVLEEGGAQEELEHAIKSNDAQTAAKLQEIKINMKALDQQNETLFGKISEQKADMIKFMADARLKCLDESKKHAENFHTRAKLCISGRGNCSISMSSFVKNGNRSLAAMSNAYGRSKKRQCLKVDGNNAFSIQYRAAQALLANQQSQLNRQHQLIAQNRQDLISELELASAQGKLLNSEATLKHARKVQKLAQDKIQLQGKIMAKQTDLQNKTKEISDMSDRIETQSATIASTRRSISLGMKNDDLSKLRESQITASDLVTAAKEAKEDGCACNSTMKTISEDSGTDFCGSATSPGIMPDEDFEAIQ